MADISLYLNNVYSSKSDDDDDHERTSDASNDDFVRVNLGAAVGARKHPRRQLQGGGGGDLSVERVPRRIIHFSSGETMEEFSTDDDEEEEGGDGSAAGGGPQSPPRNACAYAWFYFLKGPAFLLSAVLYLGEKFSALFDVTTGKYQYVIDTYYRQREREQEQMWKEMEADLAKEMEDKLAAVVVPEESERLALAAAAASRADPDAEPSSEDRDDDASQSLGDAADAATALPDRAADAPSPPRVTYHMEEDAKGTKGAALKDTFQLQGLGEPHHVV